MNGPDTFLKKNFCVRTEHLDFLNSINPDNDSKALRDCLDELKDLKDGSKVLVEKQARQVFFNNLVVVFGLACIFILFGYSSLLSDNLIIFVSSVIIGCLLLFYDVFLVVRQYKI